MPYGAPSDAVAKCGRRQWFGFCGGSEKYVENFPVIKWRKLLHVISNNEKDN